MEYRIDGDIWYGGADESDGDYCGKDCYWRIEDDVLKIRGSGDLVWAKKDSNDKWKCPNEKRGMSYRRVVIEEGIKSINEYAFVGEPVEEAEIAGSVGAVAERAFSSCEKLRRVRLKSGITEIKNSAFYFCISLAEITIPEGVTSIGVFAFWSCFALESINLPDSVSEIGNFAFGGCKALTGIIIPDGVTKIEYFTFSNACGLICIVIPNSVKEIGFWAFDDCNSLAKIIFYGTKDEWERIEIKSYNEPLKRAKTEFRQGKVEVGRNVRVLTQTRYRVDAR